MMMETRRAYLCEGHLSDDGEHDLLPLGWIWILLVLVEPGLQGRRGLAGGVLPPGRQVVTPAVPASARSLS